MKIAVIIPTYGRKAVLGQLLAHLGAQTRLPDEVVISAPDGGHVESPGELPYPVSLVLGGSGLCSQRNHALEAVLDRFDAITFFDDDFVPAPDYLAMVERTFLEQLDWAVLTGHVVLDGARGPGVTWEEALSALATAAPRPDLPPFKERSGAYGCNMSIRCSAVGETRFDERLALYGWQEDIDFTNRLKTRGRIMWVRDLKGAHLGSKSGKASGVRLGYSQMVNPIYMVRKGTMSPRFASKLIFQNLGSNIRRSWRPEPWIDCRGRLKGNLIALGHLAIGRVDPGHIKRL